MPTTLVAKTRTTLMTNATLDLDPADRLVVVPEDMWGKGGKSVAVTSLGAVLSVNGSIMFSGRGVLMRQDGSVGTGVRNLYSIDHTKVPDDLATLLRSAAHDSMREAVTAALAMLDNQ